MKRATAGTHAAQIDDRFAEDRKVRRGQSVRAAFEALRLGDEELVVDPVMLRVPPIRIGIFGGNAEIGGALDRFEVLHAPWIGLADRHWDPSYGCVEF